MQVPRNTHKLPLFFRKYEKNSIFAVFETAYTFIAGIKFLPYRLAITKLTILQSPRNTLELALFDKKIREKTAANCFSRMLFQRELIKYIK